MILSILLGALLCALAAMLAASLPWAQLARLACAWLPACARSGAAWPNLAELAGRRGLILAAGLSARAALAASGRLSTPARRGPWTGPSGPCPRVPVGGLLA